MMLCLVNFASAELGVNWTQATANANWTARYNFRAIVFDGKMWVMGGNNGDPSYTDYNDVWYSTDGINWIEATDNASWIPRQAFELLVFDNKMWVIGGFDESNVLNDVWYSSDGVNWTEATSNANWTARMRFGALTYDNKMWVMGGMDGVFSALNDVWYSSDGVNWTEATSNADWYYRYHFSSLVFDNKMWVIAGRDGGVGKSVWYSTNGINWTEATSSPDFDARYGFASTILDNKMWIMGGYGESPMNDVWYSTNGINWTQAVNIADWSARSYFKALAYDNKLWVMGGSTDGGTTALNDVWYSNPNPNNELLTNLTHYFSFDNDNFTNKISNPLYQSLDNQGTTNTTGIIGDARSCNGTDQVMTTQYIIGEMFNGTYSQNFWFKTNWTGSGSFIALYESDNSALMFYPNYIENGRISISATQQSSPNIELSFTDASWQDDNWHMLTFTKENNDANTWKFYLDAQPTNITIQLNDTIDNFNFTLTSGICGRNLYGTIDAFVEMDFDEYGVWKTTLNQTQIDDLYNSGVGLPYENFTGTPYENLCENWVCNNDSRICRNDNMKECYSVIDLNSCGTNFTGNISDYNPACTYHSLSTDNLLKNDLSYYFPYDNNNFSSSTGIGEQNNNGSINTNGILSDARYCDGTVHIENNFNMSPLHNGLFSTNFWIKLNSTDTSATSIMGYYGVDTWFMIWKNPVSDLMGWGWYSATSTYGAEGYFQNADLFDDNYHMITFTKIDEDINNIKAYFDGEEQTFTINPLSELQYPFNDTLNWFICGRNHASSWGLSEMSIDELGYWHKELNITNILDLYNNGIGLPYDNFTGNITPPCTEDWIQINGSCIINDTYLITYYDNNSCGTTINLPPDNGTYTGICNYCIENWTCDTYETCNSSNIMPCSSMVDLNFCGNNFTGNISDYDMNCTYSVSPFNGTSNDLTSATIDTGVKLIKGLGAVAVLLGITIASIGVAYGVRKIILKK